MNTRSYPRSRGILFCLLAANLSAANLVACSNDAAPAATSRSGASDKGGAGASTAGKAGGDGLRASDGSSAGSGDSPAPITKAACVLGAQGVADAGPKCIDCFCDAIAACGATCQQVLLCVVSQCAMSLNDPAAAARCALRECASKATGPDAIDAIGQALAAFSTCGSACPVPSLPASGSPASPPPPLAPPLRPAAPVRPPAAPGPAPHGDADAGSTDDAGSINDAGTADDAGV